MSLSGAEHTAPQEPSSPGAGRRGVWWWVRVAEVRLRFVIIVLLILVVITQWSRLRAAWDDWWHAWRGDVAASAVSGEIEYFCPMDPGVVSIWPAICPICNMDLVQRRKQDAQLLPEGVVARMQLSPYRVQLAGLRTSVVQAQECTLEIPLSGTLVEDAAGESPSDDPGLVFVAPVSRSDEMLFQTPRQAVVRASNGTTAEYVGLAELRGAAESSTEQVQAGTPYVRVWLDAATGLTPGTVVTAVIRVPIGADGGAATTERPQLPCVPVSAIVDHGFQQLVFVESMPGMFDAVQVTLGPRCGDRYPVLSGLAAGERVAAVGAFLIDAETRLNSSLAVGYFGADQQTADSRAPKVQLAADNPVPPLSHEDAQLAARQGICPVTELPLDAMGGPVPVEIGGRRVFICCKGCEKRLKSDPEAYLAKIPPE
jgi:Cu(I)/Ag(I) efflux system membrane fusion protein